MIVGGVDLLAKAEEQEKLLEESNMELEERRKRAEQLRKELEEKEVGYTHSCLETATIGRMMFMCLCTVCVDEMWFCSGSVAEANHFGGAHLPGGV